MGSISILHASDLHLSVHKQLRSPADLWHDLEEPWPVSARGAVASVRVAKSLFKAWWTGRAASSYDPETLEGFAEFVYEHAKRKLDGGGDEIAEEGEGRLDAVVITGDLATTGRGDDLAMISKFLGARFDPRLPYRSGESDYRGATLSAVKVPVLCLPGNHDRFVPTRELDNRAVPIFFKPGGTEFDLLVTDYRRRPVHKIELTDDPAHGPRLRVVVLAADLTLRRLDDHKGLYGWLAQGKAYGDIRRRLVFMTKRLREQKKEGEVLCVLWAVHFPPDFPGIQRASRLLGERKFIRAANRAGVDAVLAGHTHRQLTYRNPAMSFRVFCCGTTAQHEPRASTGARDKPDARQGNLFQIITVTADGAGRVELSATDYRYSSVRAEAGPRLMGWTADAAALGRL